MIYMHAHSTIRKYLLQNRTENSTAQKFQLSINYPFLLVKLKKIKQNLKGCIFVRIPYKLTIGGENEILDIKR